MSSLPIYQALAQAFLAEGVDTFFTLMGDGNMHWCTTLKNMDGVQMFHARHEHAAVSMAMAYHSATGKVGVASTTSGPGFTQIMTALATAARSRVPLVVFAGEVPIHARWNLQAIDQAPLAVASGAHYITAHSPRRMYQYVCEAFYIARYERKPVVIGVPYDMQQEALPDIGAYIPSSTLVPHTDPMPPSPAQIEALTARLANARCPVILAGKGVLAAAAQDDVEQLAERSGALLATTLPARGLFDHNPFSIGISGGYARQIATELGAQADLVIGIGASLSSQTVAGGGMYPKADMVQIDSEPVGLVQGRRAADSYVQADAGLAVRAMLDRLGAQPTIKAAIRSPELARRIRDEPADAYDYAEEPGLLDPRRAIAELDRVLAKDYDMVCGSGHHSYFHTVMRGWAAGKMHVMREFGAIGSGLSYAIGVAAARQNGKVVLFDGDGSLIMHIQEFETLKRHGLKVLICVMNDGAYGSEIHKLRDDGIDDSGAVFGRPDFAAIARGFGLRGSTVTDVGQFGDLFAGYQANGDAEVWDIHISDRVMTPRMRKNLKNGH
ncbi:MAG TPA: thiamine pyrophosphate-binding protein [Devosia sp.]|nr:thiamine pyrophosphate-binding protein [Devosia sp.]